MSSRRRLPASATIDEWNPRSAVPTSFHLCSAAAARAALTTARTPARRSPRRTPPRVSPRTRRGAGWRRCRVRRRRPGCVRRRPGAVRGRRDPRGRGAGTPRAACCATPPARRRARARRADAGPQATIGDLTSEDVGEARGGAGAIKQRAYARRAGDLPRSVASSPPVEAIPCATYAPHRTLAGLLNNTTVSARLRLSALGPYSGRRAVVLVLIGVLLVVVGSPCDSTHSSSSPSRASSPACSAALRHWPSSTRSATASPRAGPSPCSSSSCR